MTLYNILIWCTAFREWRAAFRDSSYQKHPSSQLSHWIYHHLWRHAGYCRGLPIKENPLYSQNFHMKFQLSVLPLLSPHIGLSYLSLFLVKPMFLLVCLWYNLNNLAVPIQIVRNDICAPNFKGKYNMIVGFNLFYRVWFSSDFLKNKDTCFYNYLMYITIGLLFRMSLVVYSRSWFGRLQHFLRRIKFVCRFCTSYLDCQ